MDKKKKKKKVNLITVFSPKTELVTSQFGRIHYHEWCLHEMDRLGRKFSGLSVIKKGNLCAIARS